MKTKIINLITIIFITIIFGCSSINHLKMKLEYLHDTPILKDFEFHTFKNSNDSLYFIISDNCNESDNLKYTGLEKLVENQMYDILLIPVKKKIILQSIVRGHPSSFVAENKQIITINDTLVGNIFQSPNIICNYYKK